jgi:peptide/nickel transport system permease protein
MVNLVASRRLSLPLFHLNNKLIAAMVLLAVLVLIAIVGPLLVDTSLAQPISVRTNQPPSWQHLLGTDSGGRELFAVLVTAMPQTIRLGLIAGFIGVVIGSVLGLLAGFVGGWVDGLISSLTDIMLTIPPLAILLIVAASVRSVSIELMAIIIALLAWMHPARSIRAQVLSLRQLPYVDIARVSGMSTLKIAFFEVLPNLLPIMMASFVGSVAAAILAALGLEVLGFGPQDTPTLGMTIYWSLLYGAFGRNMWWWWLPPIVVLALLFVGLFLLSAALDEVANPRLRRHG